MARAVEFLSIGKRQTAWLKGERAEAVCVSPCRRAMTGSGNDVCLMHIDLRVAQFHRLALGRDAMTVINKFVFETPTAALMKQVDIQAEMERLDSPFCAVGAVSGLSMSVRRGLNMFVESAGWLGRLRLRMGLGIG